MNLHEILWRNENQVLTPELIAGILHGAFMVEDQPLINSIGGPGTNSIGGLFPEPGQVVFTIERLSDRLDELIPMHQAQWDEIEPIREGLKPNYQGMIDAEKAGRYVLFTARKDGVLIGNTSCYLYQSMHTQKLVAKEDTMYLVPSARKGMTAIKFFKYCEERLIAAGAQEITISVKTTNDAHKLWERQGYQWTDRVLSKMIEAK